MTQLIKKWAWRLARLVVIVAAIAYLAWKVNWEDYATLAQDGRTVRAFAEEVRDGRDMVLVEMDGRREWLDDTRIKRPESKIKDQKLPLVVPGLKQVARRMGSNWGLVAFAFVLFTPIYLITAWRLRVLLKTQEVHLRPFDAMKLGYAASFLNFAVPTGTTGGDLYKAYYVAAHATGKRTEAITIVLLDRAIGLVNYVFMAAMICGLSYFAGRVGVLGGWVTILFVTSLVGGAAFFSNRVRRWFRVEDRLVRLPFGSRLVRIDRTAFSLRYHPGPLLSAFMWSFIMQIFCCMCVMLLAKASGMECAATPDHILEYALAVIVGLMIASLPGNPPQGFGTLEGIMAYVLVPHYGNFSQIFAVCIGLRLLHLVWALPGAAVLLMEPMPRNIHTLDDAEGRSSEQGQS